MYKKKWTESTVARNRFSGLISTIIEKPSVAKAMEGEGGAYKTPTQPSRDANIQ